MQLREKLKDIDLRLVDLAQLLDVSRPTAYKFIELYETGQRDKIDTKIVRVFDYICQNDASKMQAMTFILNNIIKPNIQSDDEKEQNIANLLKKESEVKIKFIKCITEIDIFDPILSYLLECESIITKNKRAKKIMLNGDEKEKLKPLKEFYNSLGFKLNIKGDKNV